MATASDEILRQLDAFGADTGKAMNTVIDDPDLYVTCLVAFALDDRFDKLDKAIAGGLMSDTAKISQSLAEAAGSLQLTPLEKSYRLLHDAAAAKNNASAAVMYSAASTAKKQFIKALCISKA